MIEAILWDNDGVLVDTEELFFCATRDAIRRAGAELTRERYIEFAMSNGRSSFELVAALGGTPSQIAALRNERDLAYAEMLNTDCLSMTGVAATLRRLKGTARMAVVTTSLRSHFDIAHRRSGLLEFFELIIAREDYRHSKPHPEPYLTALERLAVPGGRCIAIEDSERGLKSALAAGLRCVVVPNRLTRGGAFAGAYAVLEDIRSLPELLISL